MTRTHITGVRTVGIPVADQERALAFYVGTLGLEKRLDVPFGKGRWLEVAPGGAATSVALVLTPSTNAENATQRRDGANQGRGWARMQGKA